MQFIISEGSLLFSVVVFITYISGTLSSRVSRFTAPENFLYKQRKGNWISDESRTRRFLLNLLSTDDTKSRKLQETLNRIQLHLHAMHPGENSHVCNTA